MREKSERDGEKGTKKAGKNEIDIQKERGLYFKNIYYIAVFTTRSGWNGLSTHCFKELPDSSSDDDTANLDLLWKISWPLKSPRPAWNGMMQMLQNGPHPGNSSIFFSFFFWVCFAHA